MEERQHSLSKWYLCYAQIATAWREHSMKWLLAQFRVAICFNEVKARLRQTEPSVEDSLLISYFFKRIGKLNIQSGLILTKNDLFEHF